MAWFPCNINSNLGGQAELLWTNPSLQSEFTAKTISLDLSEYEAIIVEFVMDITNYLYTCCKVYAERTDFDYYGGGYSDTGTSSHSRNFKVSDMGVTFRDAHRSGAKNNNYVLPYKIYGLKNKLF